MQVRFSYCQALVSYFFFLLIRQTSHLSSFTSIPARLCAVFLHSAIVRFQESLLMEPSQLFRWSSCILRPSGISFGKQPNTHFVSTLAQRNLPKSAQSAQGCRYLQDSSHYLKRIKNLQFFEIQTIKQLSSTVILLRRL